MLWHAAKKKTNKTDWSNAVQGGKLTEALRFINPRNKNGLGPSYVMENPSFEPKFPWRRTIPERSVYGPYHPKAPI